jgi:hypothetical protein
MWSALPGRLKWIGPGLLALGLLILAWLNVSFYFGQYYAYPDILKNEAYRGAQLRLEMRSTQSRYQAALGPGYIVRNIGRPDDPLNPDTQYLARGQDYETVLYPETELPLQDTGGKGLAFLFFSGYDQYRPMVRSLYPGGADDEVRSPDGRHLFYTYIVQPRK